MAEIPEHWPEDIAWMTERLRRLHDLGGYDGYGYSDSDKTIANKLEDLYRSWTSEQAQHAAWRKRANEAEARIRELEQGTIYKTGVMEPQTAPVVSLGTGAGVSWVAYRYVYRSSTTGATSNPSPESAPQTVYYTTFSATMTMTESTDPQVDKIDISRQTPGLDNFTYVGTIENSAASTGFTDTLTDLQVAANPQLSFDNKPSQEEKP